MRGRPAHYALHRLWAPVCPAAAAVQFADATAAADYAALLDTLAARLGMTAPCISTRIFPRIALHQGRRECHPDLCGYSVRPAPRTAAGAAQGASFGPRRSSVNPPGPRPRTPAALAQGTQRCKLDKNINFPAKSPNRTCKIAFHPVKYKQVCIIYLWREFLYDFCRRIP